MANQDRIRVMLVDDHAMVRRGLTAFLKTQPDIELVSEAADGEEAVRLCGLVQPDVVLMDLLMPKLDGTAATEAIRERWPNVQVIALTSFQEKELVLGALHAGAISYLLKNVSGEDLAEAIRAAHRGKPTLAAEAIRALVEPAGAEPLPGGDLTAREREVLSYLVKGMTNAQIAAHLTVSRATVKAHVSNILSKMSVTNRAEAIALAIRGRLVT